MTDTPEPLKTTPEEADTTTFNSLVGINEAARLTKRGKGQIGQDSKSGRLSFEVDLRGNKKYRVSELERVYGLKVQDNTSAEIQAVPPQDPPQTIIENAVLKERVARLESENQYLRQNHDRLLSQNDRLTMLLAPPVAEPIPAPPAPLSFWQRLFSPKAKS